MKISNIFEHFWCEDRNHFALLERQWKQMRRTKMFQNFSKACPNIITDSFPALRLLSLMVTYFFPFDYAVKSLKTLLDTETVVDELCTTTPMVPCPAKTVFATHSPIPSCLVLLRIKDY
jgi:hypothetical protein